jgi:hypothetical protein
MLVIMHRDHAFIVRALFSGVDIIRFRFVWTWGEVFRKEIPLAQAQQYELLPLPSYRDSCPYASWGMDRRVAFDSFACDRDAGREQSLLALIRGIVGDAEYAVVHGSDRIRSDLVPQKYVVVDVGAFPHKDPFDWIQVMDHAAQVHAIDSHFLQVADKVAVRASLFCHAYSDNAPGWITGGYSKRVVFIWGT